MRRVLMMIVLVLVGCQNTIGPFQARSPTRVDSPYITLTEQEARARNRWALPDDSPKVGPPSGNEFLGWK